jgi:ubiquinone/menaquinone biosynthesis C-methylase UbiE
MRLGGGLSANPDPILSGTIPVMIRMVFLLCGAALAALSQASDTAAHQSEVDALVKQLFPKSERMARMKLPDIFSALGVKPGSTVADVGAGEGGFSVLLSHVVGTGGRVYAVDIDEKGAVRPLRKRARRDRLHNLEVIHGEEDNPKLPAGKLDAVMVINSYHEFVKHQAMLTNIRQALRPGGRLVMVEPLAVKTRTRPRDIQTRNHVLSPDLAEQELRDAGFAIVDRRDHFVDDPDAEGAQWLIAAQSR